MFLIALPLSALAQRTVAGTVFEDDGTTPLTGATVMQVGHPKNAVSTDLDGKFTINVTGKKPVLKITFIGYDPKEVAVDGTKPLKVVMQTNAVKLDDVVVTALGITREQKSLGYAVTKVSNEELTNTVSGNWLNAMNGKVAGMTMDAAGTGPMGSMRVVLRGDQSLNYGANEALFVVDGVPISSGGTTSGSGSNFTNADAPVDFGNDAADINPDDVESVSVLKGPAATALYGSRAANGAIVITTKSGKTDKGIGVTVNSSVTWEKASYWPDFQKEYGPGNTLGQRPFSTWSIPASKSPTGVAIAKNCGNIAAAFGEKFDASIMRYNYLSYNFDTDTYTGQPYVYAEDWYTGFFQTGVTYKNSVTVEGGNGKGNRGRVSVTDTRNEWILPNTGYKTNSVSTSFNMRLNKWISVSSRVNYFNKRADNVPASGYNQNGIIYKLLWLDNFTP
ncbi:MAG: TonB-dependent receptor plug domain-containing protein, partial [Muribaculaceae bacterium]|nr:TonB-dependent receptor plug domain-containing protein [Muribaculaceae bacterium]